MLKRFGLLSAAVAALVAAGAMRVAAEATRRAIGPDAGVAGVAAGDSVRVGQLDSYALGLLLGGLRGPLTIALWNDLERQRVTGQYDDYDSKAELIRLLQPQFDRVHISQSRMKAYDVGADRAGVASRYAAVIDGIDYLRRVAAGRPADLDLTTELGKLYANKLGGSDERDAFGRRVRRETQAREPPVRIEFDAARQAELTAAAARAGVSPRDLLVRPADGRPGRLVTLLRESEAEELEGFDAGRTTLRPKAQTTAVGRAQRLPPLLDESGDLAADLARPRRDRPDGVAEGDFLDGAPLQFLREFAPFPEGVGPLALAYNEFQKARVLQEFAGQRSVEEGYASVFSNPGRALRDWAVEAYEVGRQLEAEAYGRPAPTRSKLGTEQARAELASAAMPPGGEVPYPALLRRAVSYYDRSRSVNDKARQYLGEHIARFPESANIFAANLDRLRLYDVLLAADVAYARGLLGEDVDLARVASLYREADDLARDYLLRYHAVQSAMPEGVPTRQVMSLDEAAREAVYRRMQQQRDAAARGAGYFEPTRAMDEFDGYRARIARRLALIDAPATRASDRG